MHAQTIYKYMKNNKKKSHTQNNNNNKVQHISDVHEVTDTCPVPLIGVS